MAKNEPAKTDLLNTDDLIRQRFDALRARKAEIESQSASLRAQRQALLDRQNELIVEIQAVTAQIDAIERPEIISLGEEISKMARVLGGKAMSDNTATEA